MVRISSPSRSTEYSLLLERVRKTVRRVVLAVDVAALLQKAVDIGAPVPDVVHPSFAIPGRKSSRVPGETSCYGVFRGYSLLARTILAARLLPVVVGQVNGPASAATS